MRAAGALEDAAGLSLPDGELFKGPVATTILRLSLYQFGELLFERDGLQHSGPMTTHRAVTSGILDIETSTEKHAAMKADIRSNFASVIQAFLPEDALDGAVKKVFYPLAE